MPGWPDWDPDIDERPQDGPINDTIIRRKPRDEEDEDIPPHPGAPFGIPNRRRRMPPSDRPPLQMGNREPVPHVPEDIEDSEDVPPFDGTIRDIGRRIRRVPNIPSRKPVRHEIRVPGRTPTPPQPNLFSGWQF